MNGSNEELEGICDDIYWLLKELKFADIKAMCNSVFDVLYDEGHINIDDEDERVRFYDKYRRIFDRAKKKKHKATEGALQNLRIFNNALYKTDEYQDSPISTCKLSVTEKRELSNMSIELEKKLRKKFL